MKKPIVIVVLVLTVIGAYAGMNNYLFSTTSGHSKTTKKAMTASESSWRWESPSGKNTFSLDLLTDGTTITGTHCGVFNNGEKIDCANDNDTNTVQLNEVSTNVFEGTIKSTYSETFIPVRLTFSNNTVNLTITSPSNEDYFIPNNITLVSN